MDEFIWSEKYRPRTIEACILSDDLKTVFRDFVKGGEFPHLLLSGDQGTGKTTVARALCEELGMNYILVNGSKDNGIDVLRTKIENFATTISLNMDGKPKVVIFDEADFLSNATQPALRSFLDTFGQNCRFIFTCNYIYKIIPALQSRCSVYDFTVKRKEMQKSCTQFLSRLQGILESEGIEFDKKALVQLIIKFAPDWRRLINECQRYASNGKIDSGILANLSSASIDDLIPILKGKQYKKLMKWVKDASDVSPSALNRLIFDNVDSLFTPSSIPMVIDMINENQKAQVADQEIHTLALLGEIMFSDEVEFKE